MAEVTYKIKNLKRRQLLTVKGEELGYMHDIYVSGDGQIIGFTTKNKKMINWGNVVKITQSLIIVKTE